MRGSIVLDDRRMLHGYVGGPLLEVLGDGISTVVHHLLHELIGFTDSTHRLIYEVTLCRRPLLQVVLPGAGVKMPDLELANPLPAIGQLLFGGTLVTALSDDATVLWPELVLQPPRLLLTGNESPDDHQQKRRQLLPAPMSLAHSPFSSLPGPSTIDDLLCRDYPRLPGVNRSGSQPGRVHADVAVSERRHRRELMFIAG